MKESALSRNIEKLSLPAESLILDSIKQDSTLTESLSHDARIILIGTDKNLTLPKGLRQNFPNSSILIIDRNKEAQNWYQNNLPHKENIQLITGEIGKGSYPELHQSANLIIVKHLLHFLKEPEKKAFLSKTMDLLSPQGTLLISLPLLFKNALPDKVLSVYNSQTLGKGINKFVLYKINH